MDYDNNIDIIIKLINAKYEKSLCAINQKYENAAKFRDTEKNLEKKLYHIITETDEDKHHTSRIYIETIRRYLLKEYNYDYPSYWTLIEFETGKAFLRDLKLKKLGI